MFISFGIIFFQAGRFLQLIIAVVRSSIVNVDLIWHQDSATEPMVLHHLVECHNLLVCNFILNLFAICVNKDFRILENFVVHLRLVEQSILVVKIVKQGM